MIRAFLAAAIALFVSACAEETAEPDPLDTARELLDLHGLLGRSPADRSPAERERPVDRSRLEELFLDLGKDDPFLEDLYVGFVVGALASNQANLRVARQGSRAEVAAGRARVVMRLVGDRYRIALAASVPDEIRRRAAAEKARHERNLAAGR